MTDKKEKDNSMTNKKITLKVKNNIAVELEFQGLHFEKTTDETELEFVNRAKRVIESKIGIDLKAHFKRENIIKVNLDERGDEKKTGDLKPKHKPDRCNTRSLVFMESDGKTYTIQDYEKLVEKARREDNIELLLEHSEKMDFSHRPYGMRTDKDFTFQSWYEFLNKNGSKWARDILDAKYAAAKDYDMVSWTYECFIEGLKEREEYIDPSLYYVTGYYKYIQVNDAFTYDEMIKLYEGKILSAGSWYQKAVEAGYPKTNISEGAWCISYFDNWEKKRKESTKKSGSCYIATAVYGSYDCPQVWTLRRFRDNILANNFFGRVFIRAYYATSPTLVKYCGNKTWFQKVFRRILNSFVLKLKEKGIEDTPYEDRL